MIGWWRRLKEAKEAERIRAARASAEAVAYLYDAHRNMVLAWERVEASNRALEREVARREIFVARVMDEVASILTHRRPFAFIGWPERSVVRGASAARRSDELTPPGRTPPNPQE